MTLPWVLLPPARTTTRSSRPPPEPPPSKHYNMLEEPCVPVCFLSGASSNLRMRLVPNLESIRFPATTKATMDILQTAETVESEIQVDVLLNIGERHRMLEDWTRLARPGLHALACRVGVPGASDTRTPTIC